MAAHVQFARLDPTLDTTVQLRRPNSTVSDVHIIVELGNHSTQVSTHDRGP